MKKETPTAYAKKLGIAFVKKGGKVEAKQGNKTLATSTSAGKVVRVLFFSKN